MLKMYILVKDDLDVGNAILAACHGTAACIQKFADDPDMKTWLDGVFRKVVCKVNQAEFNNAKGVDKGVLMTESALNNAETAIAFCPREEWPKMFKFFRLYKEKSVDTTCTM